MIVPGLDTMVMDNDETHKRQGAKPTHKKVKGFQPLQTTWGRFINANDMGFPVQFLGSSEVAKSALGQYEILDKYKKLIRVVFQTSNAVKGRQLCGRYSAS